MNASIQEKHGYLYAVINYTDSTGKKKYKWISTGLKEHGNRRLAKEMMDSIVSEFEEKLKNEELLNRRHRNSKDNHPEYANMMFTDYCLMYLKGRKSKLSEMVYYNYTNCYMSIFRKFFDKRKLRLIDVTEKELTEFYDLERARGIKEITLKKYNNVLRPVLKMAYKNRLIPDNPFDFMEPIHREKPNISFYDKDEMAQLLKVIKGHPLEIPFMLAAYYGFRRSEVLGIRWSAIDFEHKLITINHKLTVVDKVFLFSDKLKTKTSYRTLPLIPVVEKRLLEHRAQIKENRKFYGNTYIERFKDYVCVLEDGGMVYPDHMTKEFGDLLKKHNMRHIRLHDLRHSCASNMIASGVPMKEIQEWLGHSNFSTTADVYSHLDFSFKIKAANIIANVYSGEDYKNEKEEDNLDALLKVQSEMKELGIDSFEEYLKVKRDGN